MPDISRDRVPASPFGDRQSCKGQAPISLSGARVVVFSKRGCHLCDDACREVARIADDLGVAWAEQDISNDEQLMTQWAEYVPVILVDGEVHGWFRVDETRLRAALR